MFIATIVRNRKNGKIYVRYGDKPQTGGDVDVVDLLNGGDKDELKLRATLYVEKNLHGTISVLS